MKNNKTKILIVLLAIMIIVNAVLLYFLYAEPERDNKENKRSALGVMLQDEIKFSPAQMVEYDTIKSKHRQDSRSIMQGMRDEKKQMLQNLAAANFSDSAIKATAIISAQNQARMEETMLTNLKKIRSICTAEQLQQFDTSFYKAMSKKRGRD